MSARTQEPIGADHRRARDGAAVPGSHPDLGAVVLDSDRAGRGFELDIG